MLRTSFLSLSLPIVSMAALMPRAFNPLPLGSVYPSGWLTDQLNVQVNGLAGHEMDFYQYVAQGDWTGGTQFYNTYEEAGPYWFNGLVPTGVLSKSSRIQNQTQFFLNYVLDHIQPDGWIGPETGSKPKYLWGRYPFLLGATQMVEADPSLRNVVLPAIHKFVALSNTMLHNGTGVDAWATGSRWPEYQLTLQWLIENDPSSSDQAIIMDTMKLLRDKGLNWNAVFNASVFPQGPVEGLKQTFGTMAWHGVNMAMGLKSGGVAYRYNGNQSDLAASSAAWDILFKYHGRPSGTFGADEHLAGMGATRGTELCLVVETMWSGSYLYQLSGSLKYADRTERMAYNALPGTMTGDMWSHQYLQQENQIAAQNMNPNPFPSDGAYSNVFGLQPQFPCCTVNHPQGWPKFISNAFVTSPDGTSLAQVYMGPFSTSVNLAGKNQVTVTVNTLYPFSDILTTTINAAQAFTYRFRVPSWVVNGSIAINGAKATGLKPDAISGMQSVEVAKGKTTIVVNLPAVIITEARLEGAIAIQRGPLNYVLDIKRNATTLHTNAQQPLAKDYQFEATSTWAFAIDPSTAVFHPSTLTTLPSPVFDSNLTGVSISVKACPVKWGTSGSLISASPPQNPACAGAQTTITLTPFGATKLRIGEFPTFKAT